MNCPNDACQSRCCKYVIIPLSGDIPEDYKDWLELHLAVIVECEGRRALAIPCYCDHLMNNGLCGIHESLDRCSICRRGYTEQKEGMVWFEGCCYEPPKGAFIIKDNQLFI